MKRLSPVRWAVLLAPVISVGILVLLLARSAREVGGDDAFQVPETLPDEAAELQHAEAQSDEAREDYLSENATVPELLGKLALSDRLWPLKVKALERLRLRGELVARKPISESLEKETNPKVVREALLALDALSLERDEGDLYRHLESFSGEAQPGEVLNTVIHVLRRRGGPRARALLVAMRARARDRQVRANLEVALKGIQEGS